MPSETVLKRIARDYIKKNVKIDNGTRIKFILAEYIYERYFFDASVVKLVKVNLYLSIFIKGKVKAITIKIDPQDNRIIEIKWGGIKK